MKKAILLAVITIMLFCVSCGSKDATNVKDELATSKKDNTENNTTDEDEIFCDTTYDYLADGFTNLARFVETKSESTLFVFEKKGPIVVYSMDDETEKIIEGVISDLTNGDLVAVKCDRIKETYPGQTEVYAIKKLEDGTIDDIPSNTLEKLREMGWIE